MRYRISELARAAGTPPTTLRYYERAGLLVAERSRSGYRLYGDDALDRLRLITAGKGLGLRLAQIRELLGMRGRGRCSQVKDRLRPMLAERLIHSEAKAVTLAIRIERLHAALHQAQSPAAAGPCAPGCGCLEHPNGAKTATGAPGSGSEPGPPVACSLAGPEQADRLQQWQRLLGHAHRREPIDGGLRIHLPAALAGPIAELAAAEQQCCAFFAFTIELAGAELVLKVRAPREAAPLLAAVFEGPGTGR